MGRTIDLSRPPAGTVQHIAVAVPLWELRRKIRTKYVLMQPQPVSAADYSPPILTSTIRLLTCHLFVVEVHRKPFKS